MRSQEVEQKLSETKFPIGFSMSILIVSGFSLAIIGAVLVNFGPEIEMDQHMRDGLTFFSIGVAVLGMALNQIDGMWPDKKNDEKNMSD